MDAPPTVPGRPPTARPGAREVTWDGPALLRVRQTVELQGEEPGGDATGPYWVFAVVRVHSGVLRYLHGRAQVAPPGPCFAVFMPPGSIVRAARTVCVASTDAVASDAPLFSRAPARPVAWQWRGGRPPRTVEGIAVALRRASPLVEVSREVDPTETALRAKAILDSTYRYPVTLGRLATRAGLSLSVMSRAFKRAYGMPPVEYRHRLRVMDAVFRLGAGGEILTVLHDVGFGDASRFYSHFRSLLCAPPGSQSARRPKNAKT